MRGNNIDELNDVGDAHLGDLQSRLSLQNTVNPSNGWVYRREYSHGDLVTSQFAGTNEVKKIGRVEIRFDQDQRCQIRLEFVEP